MLLKQSERLDRLPNTAVDLIKIEATVKSKLIIGKDGFVWRVETPDKTKYDVTISSINLDIQKDINEYYCVGKGAFFQVVEDFDKLRKINQITAKNS